MVRHQLLDTAVANWTSSVSDWRLWSKRGCHRAGCRAHQRLVERRVSVIGKATCNWLQVSLSSWDVPIERVSANYDGYAV